MNRFVFLFVCSAVFCSILKADIPPEERAALIELYGVLNDSGLPSSWLDEQGRFRPPWTEDSWRGVGFSIDQKHVSFLWLSIDHAVTIPDSISDLHQLIVFSIYGGGEADLSLLAVTSEDYVQEQGHAVEIDASAEHQMDDLCSQLIETLQYLIS